MPPWFNIASLRSALFLGRHRVETVEDAINLVDRLSDGRNVPASRSQDVPASLPAGPASNVGKRRTRS